MRLGGLGGVGMAIRMEVINLLIRFWERHCFPTYCLASQTKCCGLIFSQLVATTNLMIGKRLTYDQLLTGKTD